jgi:uncharacterized membrane protein YphA (DoxX/SURF4 family)
MKFLANFSRVIVGAYLIFSGFLKVVDPYGTALKLKEYFEVFALDIPAMSGFFSVLSENSVTLSVVFCCLELLVGIALLFGFKLKLTAWVTLLLMTFFTFLTFYSAYFNKVTDCGCFGEFLKLDPWSSFWKNVVAMVFILIIFIYRSKFKNSVSGTPAVLIGFLISLGIALYSLKFLPVIDMLPYAVGKSIPKQMEKPNIQAIFEYEFLDNNSKEIIKSQEYLMDTARYVYQDSRVLNEKDIKPVLVDFSLSDTSGNEAVSEVLSGNKLVLIIKTTNDIDEKSLKKYKDLVSKTSKSPLKPLVLSSDTDIEKFLVEIKLNHALYFADEKLLKTMARNNPVLYLLSDGVVMGKWSFNNLPSDSKVKKLIK